MDSFERLIAEQKSKIKEVEDFIGLYSRKREIRPQTEEIHKRLNIVHQLTDDCSKMVEKYKKNVEPEYERLAKKLQSQELIMLHIMDEVKKQELQTMRKKSAPVLLTVTPSTTSHKRIAPRKIETPRLYLSDYEESPYASKMRPVSLQFVDFEIYITDEMFNQIPKYLRGRDTTENFRDFVDTVVIPCFTEKYQLLYKKKEYLGSTAEMDLRRVFSQQALLFPNQKFITYDDITRKLQKTIDKKVSSRIAMLRHIKILQETRKDKTIFLLWIAN